MWNCKAKKVCWLVGGAWGCLHLWNWVECPYVLVKFTLVEIRWHAIPIGNMMGVWKLKHQVVHILTNPSKRKFEKGQSLLLQIRSKQTIRNNTSCKFQTHQMQNWIRYDMKSNTSEEVYMCQQTSKMCSSHPTWKSLASVMNVEVGAPETNLPNARRL